MAYLEQNKYCYVCEKTSNHVNGKCPHCEEKKERERIAVWNALTVEEKLQNLRRRVEELERGEPMY